jgi:hypothetical protein
MKCKNDPKKSYTGTEPSPKGLGYCAHAEKIGVIKQGKDKNQWIVKQTKNGSKRWVKQLHNKAKSYFIHDNGGRPFLVYVQPNNEVFIYKKDETYQIDESELSHQPKNNRWMYIKLVKNYKPLKTFIGKSPLNEMTKFSGGYGAKFTGNTILLQISKDKYVHIGSEIKEYTIKEQIVKYVSPVGNNDVPYSYGIDKDNVYYLFGENVSMKDIPKEYKNDPYEYYYQVYLITPDEAYRPPKEQNRWKKIRSIRI